MPYGFTITEHPDNPNLDGGYNMKERISHPKSPNLLSHISGAVLCDGWLYISGQGPLDMSTRSVVAGDIQSETQLTLENIQAILEKAGGKLEDVVKCTCYLSNLEHFPGFDETYKKFFASNIPPARTTSQAALLKGIKVEIDAVARLSS